MNILISGGSGLLGHVLVDKLSQHHHIFLLTKHTHLLSSKNISYLPCDLSTDFNFKNFPKTMDVIIHLAQSPLYKDFPKSANNIFDINVKSTHQLLDYGLKSKIQHFIYTSSGSVYEPYDSELNEDSVVNPSSFYANSKLICERLVNSYAPFFNTSIFRLFFLYGPHPQTKHTLINNLFNKIKSHEPITIEGKNSGLIFSPTFTIDLANFFDIYLKDDRKGIYNLANPQPLSFLEVIQSIANKLEMEPNIIWNHHKTAPKIIPNLNKFSQDFPTFKFTNFNDSLIYLDNFLAYEK